MGESAFDGYVDRWREASPQRALAWMFLDPAERVRYGALAAIEEEWLKAVRDVREPQVAGVKLGWWREEAQRAREGQPRHPLTEVLFADTGIRAIALPYWTAPMDAAIVALTAPPPADFAAQRDVVAPLAEALAALEARVWFGPDVDSQRAAEVILLGDVVSRVRALDAEIERGRPPLPMNLLARHGITLEGLATDDLARRAAVRDQLGDLERALSRAATMPGPLSLFRAVALRHDLDTLRRALRADAPLAALRMPGHGFGSVLKTWHAARIWRATARSRSRP
ncbi:MAG: squalene/phytoene synthase family protein [Rhodanobacteraceae bacterium]